MSIQGRTAEKMGLFRGFYGFGDTENPLEELAGDTLMKKTLTLSDFPLTFFF
jgi:hypothetical protein